MWIPLCFYFIPYIGASYLVTVPVLVVLLYFAYKKEWKKLYFYSALGFLSWVLFTVTFWYTQSYIDSHPRLECETSTNITLTTMLGVVAIVYLITAVLTIKKVSKIFNERITKLLSLAYALCILIPAVYLSSYEVRGSRFEIVDVLSMLPMHTAFYLYEGKLLDF